MIEYTNLARYFDDIKSEYTQSLEQIAKSEIVFNGPYTKQVESELEKRSGRKHALLCTSGSQALSLIFLHLGIQPGDEIITTNYGPPAIVGPITVIGAVPRFCDVNEYGSIDCDHLKNLLSPKTKAVVAVGLYGDVHDHDSVKSFCDEHNLVYINDANQSCFAKYKGVESLSLGDFATMGFAENKPIPTMATFGAVLFDKTEIYESFSRLRKHGKSERFKPIIGTGYNSWPDEQRSAQILLSLNRFDDWQVKRNRIADFYNDKFQDIEVRPRPTYSEWNTHKYAIMFKDKIKAHDRLLQLGIRTVPHYTDSFGGSGYEMTEKFIKQSLSIPLNPYMTDAEVYDVVSAVKKVYDE